MNKLKFSEMETINSVSKKSFVGSFLSSMRQKCTLIEGKK